MKKSIFVCFLLLFVAAFSIPAIEQSKNQKELDRGKQLAAIEKEIKTDLSVDESYKHMESGLKRKR